MYLLLEGRCLIVVQYDCIEDNMPKVRTRSSAKKRFKKNANGSFKRAQGCKNHLLTKKTTKKKRQLRKEVFIESGKLKKTLGILMPY